MMVGLFAAAIVGDLIFLPAMLLGPLGRLFVAPIEPRVVRRATRLRWPIRAQSRS